MPASLGSLGRRLASGALTLWIVSIIIFVASQLLPGNPGRAMLGPTASEESVQAVNTRLGFDRPVLERYADWFGGLLHGDLGQSYTYGIPVADVLGAPLVRSLQLGAVAFLIGIPLAVVLGALAAHRPRSPLDRGVVGAGLLLSVTPAFVLGIVLILVFAVGLDALPVNASAPPGATFAERIPYLVMPAVTLVAVLFGYVTRVARAGFAEELSSPYARTAALKGVSDGSLLVRHAARNALAPTTVVVATQGAYLIGGGVVIEKLFNYPGMGLVILNACSELDIPVLAAAVMLMGAVQVLLNLVADLGLVALDPRLRARR